jgi:hypothetical protein
MGWSIVSNLPLQLSVNILGFIYIAAHFKDITKALSGS